MPERFLLTWLNNNSTRSIFTHAPVAIPWWLGKNANQSISAEVGEKLREIVIVRPLPAILFGHALCYITITCWIIELEFKRFHQRITLIQVLQVSKCITVGNRPAMSKNNLFWQPQFGRKYHLSKSLHILEGIVCIKFFAKKTLIRSRSL